MQENRKMQVAHNLIQEVQLSATERQTELVTKLKEERDAAKLSNNN